MHRINSCFEELEVIKVEKRRRKQSNYLYRKYLCKTFPVQMLMCGKVAIQNLWRNDSGVILQWKYGLEYGY